MITERVVLKISGPANLGADDLEELIVALRQAYDGLTVAQIADGASDSGDVYSRLIGGPTPTRPRFRPSQAHELLGLAEGYLELLSLTFPASAGRRRFEVDPGEVHRLVPEPSRLILANARFDSPGFFGFFANKGSAEIIDTSLSHRRETRVLKSGGTEAEVQRRQAEADKATASARMANAAADEREAEARENAKRSVIGEERLALQETLLRNARNAIESGAPPEQIAALLAYTHQGITMLGELSDAGTITDVNIVERPQLGTGTEDRDDPS